jgi:hypothetical protein
MGMTLLPTVRIDMPTTLVEEYGICYLDERGKARRRHSLTSHMPSLTQRPPSAAASPN